MNGDPNCAKLSKNPVLRKPRNPSFRCWGILEMTPVARESRNTLFHSSGFRREIHGGDICTSGGQRFHAKGSVKFLRLALPPTRVRLSRGIPFTSLRYYESGTNASFRKILVGRKSTHEPRESAIKRSHSVLYRTYGSRSLDKSADLEDGPAWARTIRQRLWRPESSKPRRGTLA